jgi:tetratricopeptide (TPR) repeat protein
VLKGNPRTIESDLYSVGALLYRFFSGRDLFDDADLESLRERHIWASPRPLTSISYVSRTIADIVENLVHKDPSLRQPAFEALKNELKVNSVAAVQSPAFGITAPLEKGEQFLHENVDRLRILIVEAPAGFGKTRYIEDLRYRMALRVPTLAFSVCPTVVRSPEATVARWLLSVFERYCSSFEDPSVRRLQAFVDDNVKAGPEYSQERIVHDLVDVLSSIAQKTPLILAVEDIDRTNRKVGRLIASIVSRATRLQLCIVITSRPGGIAAKMSQAFKDYVGSALEHISLGHLQAADCDSIASFLEPDEDRRSAAVRKSGGNPLFLEAYCQNHRPGVPRRVRSTVSNLVGKLPLESRRVAELLALFEEPVTLKLLQQVSGATDLEQPLAVLRNLGLSDNNIAIRHGDTRAFLYSRIQKKRRTALHALSYAHLKDSGTDKENLAWHAYHGGLFEVAASLYLELAQRAIQSREFASTVRFYGIVHQCRRRNSTVPPPTIEEAISLARCRGYLGDSSSARKALRPLLTREAVLADPELLSSVYAASASPFIECSNEERIRLLRLAIECLPSNSPTLIHRKMLLVNALLLVGRVDESENALDDLCTATMDDIARGESIAMRAMVLTSRGKFRQACDCLAGNQLGGFIQSSLKTNVAFCLEQLGELRHAAKLQTEALREAKSPSAEIICLTNLGSMETKLGNIKSAENLLERAITEFDRMRRVEPLGFPLGTCFADAALHWIERGSYRKAAHCLDRRPTAIDSTSHGEKLHYYFSQCELYLALGEQEAATEILEKTNTFGTIGEFWGIERVLIQCRLEAPAEHVCDQLRNAVHNAKRLETQYQQCRALILLAQNLSVLGNLSLAKVAAGQALDLAQRNGYRLLAAQAYLRRGLATENDAHKQSDLIRCLHEASTMCLLPLLAECSSHIGAWRYSSSDYLSAREHLSRSVAIITQMAEGLDSIVRKNFLSLPLYQNSRRLLQEATTRTQEFTSAFREPAVKDDLFFGSLYRLTSASAGAPDLTSIVSILIHSLRQWIPHPGMVMLQNGRKLTLHPLEEGAGEDMRDRAINAFRKGGAGIYFDSFAEKDTQSSTAWIPIPCLTLKSGIYIECINGPAALDELEIQYLAISAAIVGAALDRNVPQRPDRSNPPLEVSGIVGISESIQKVHVDIEVAAGNSATVLIEGESGSGKELVAQAIHSRSLRAKGPFVPVDCGALPEGLIEAELFGAKKGSFTGADDDRRGLFEEADHGTIFLDEIGNASLPFQTKLLRVLQEREIRRVGDTKGKRIDVRVIAATNCNLARLVEDGRFRQDLLFRLKVLHIQLPPLRERKQDIPLLVNAFLSRLNTLNKTSKGLRAETMDYLLTHDYPGNVRELQNAIEQAFYRSDGNMIAEIALHKEGATVADDSDEMQSWLRGLNRRPAKFLVCRGRAL